MKKELAIDPLERSCTELFLEDARSDADERRDEITSMPVRELVDVPVFVLLGEPGMGKTETMKALADQAHSKCITVNHFIVSDSVAQDRSIPLFIDALDEARAEFGTTVWKELRQRIGRSAIERFGLACRAADWSAVYKEDLSSMAQGQSVRVFTLDSLTSEQRRRVLQHKGIADVDGFEANAEALGFADMLGNPQSLLLLVAAIEGQNHQWPDSRREAYELACKALVKESNSRHRQAQRQQAPIAEEALLDAAGWLCALMLLSNSNEVFEDADTSLAGTSVLLSEVMHTLPADGASAAEVKQVLQRRLFITREGQVGHAPVHRTVAEYLAARYIAQRISSGGLLPTRVASLMLATPRHLVGNLRGLAGWLAALCEPMRSAIFDADPAAVLSYGDLHLLPTATKQALIKHLARHPDPQLGSDIWQQASVRVPLVQQDMRDFVKAWLTELRGVAEPSAAQVFVAHVLLSALVEAPRDLGWEFTLLAWVRDGHSHQGVRSSAIHALTQHCTSPKVLIDLLDEMLAGELPDTDGRSSDLLLQHLYPDHLGPSQVLRYLSPRRVHQGRFPEFGEFWSYYIKKKTPRTLLAELIEALATAREQGVFETHAFLASPHGLRGLGSLAISALESVGTTVPTPQLARWLLLFAHHERTLSRSLSSDDAERLMNWFQANPEIGHQVLKHWIDEGVGSWEAQNQMPTAWRPWRMGAFWLDQIKAVQGDVELTKASEWLKMAVWWLDQPDSGITLDDVFAVVQGNKGLEEALQSQLVSSLDANNWERRNWLDNRKYREQVAVREEANERNRRHVLDHLDDVRSGKLSRYLNEAAWSDLEDSGYSGGLRSGVINRWRETHPELDAATCQGYLTLLSKLTIEQAEAAIKSRQKNSMWNFELPCLVAAEQLFSKDPVRFFEQGKERLQALLTVFLIHHVSKTDWLLALIDQRSEWVEEVWWSLGEKALRSKTQIRIPFLYVLARESRAHALALRLLPRFLASWPVKFPEESFAEFSQLLKAALKICPEQTGLLVRQRLRKRSLSSKETAYLVMAGLWVDPAAFAPMIDTLVRKQQIVQSELLDFIGHMHRHGSRVEELPNWDASTMGLLFSLFGPLCKPDWPEGGWVGSKESGREFLYQLLDVLRRDTSAAAQSELQKLLLVPTLNEWKVSLENALVRQSQFRAERSFAQPTARQVALTLQNKAPANPADLMAVGLDALLELQKVLRNSPTNLINQFWMGHSAGKRPLPPHRPEPQCRDVIAEWLKSQLSAIGLSVDPEHQHGGQNQSDIVLRMRSPDRGDMVLPIEVKGDWNTDLWTAPHRQLALRYASDPTCFSQGIYLVLWLGAQRGSALRPKQHPNHPANTPQAYQELLQREVEQNAPGLNIQVVVLDVSIDPPRS